MHEKGNNNEEHMKYMNWVDISMQPSFRLVALLEETIEYNRLWTLTFHTLTLCVSENLNDPSWIELQETGERIAMREGQIAFMPAGTPARIRFTEANRHLSIQFRYELFSGIDVFDGLRGYFLVNDADKSLAARIKAVFAKQDPTRRFAAAESVTLAAILPFWPKRLATDLMRLAPYEDALRIMADTVDNRTSVRDLARRMGLPDAHFASAFRSLVGMSPKQWLEQALFFRARRMLSDPHRKIRDIAFALEFADEFNFTRFVKRRCGYSPSKLRAAPQGPITNWK